MPIVGNFRSTDQWKAFTLNSIVASLTVVIAIITKQYLDKINVYGEDTDKNTASTGRNVASVIITLLVTFSTSMIVFLIMFILFGFGGGMLAQA